MINELQEWLEDEIKRCENIRNGHSANSITFKSARMRINCYLRVLVKVKELAKVSSGNEKQIKNEVLRKLRNAERKDRK